MGHPADVAWVRRPPARSLSLRTVLVATLVLPLFTTAAFGAVWAVERAAEAERANTVSREIAALSVLTELQFGIETTRLYRGLDPSMLPEGISSGTSGGDARAATGSWDEARALLDDSADLDEHTDGHGTELLRRVVDRHEASIADPALPTIDADLASSASDLRRLIEMVRADSDQTAVVRTDVFDQLSQLQALMLHEARAFLTALGSDSPTAPQVIEIMGIAAREDAIIDQIRTRLDPATDQRFLDGLAGVDFQKLRDAIAVEAGVATGPSFAQVLTPERMAAVRGRYHTLADVRRSLAEQIAAETALDTAEANRWMTSTLVVAAALTALTLATAGVVSRLVTRRLTLVTEAASRIGDGDIDERPLPPGGLREIAEVSIAFNRMSELLLTLDRQVSAIGAARLDDPWLDKTLPGRIGSELQQSVRLIAETNERLRGAEALANAIIDAAVDAIVTIDGDERITTANQAAADLAGVAGGELDGRSLHDVFPDLPPFDVLVRRADSMAVSLYRPNGDAVPTLVSAREVHDADGAPTRAYFLRDISERVAWERRLRHQATHNELTDLPNRVALAERLATISADRDRDRRPAALLCVDLDRFKYVNEAHGIHNGDRVLRVVAERLVGAAGPDDHVVHIGGDEFAVLVRSTADPVDLVVLAESFRTILSAPIELTDERLTLQSCVGIASIPDATAGADELLRFADVALTVAKQAGAGTVRVYDESMSDSAERRTRLEQRLRTALATDQLEMFAQPIVDLHDGHVEGVELLARWRHEGEWIPPDVFIPIAEESGLIQALGRWAMGRAVDLLVEFERAGLDQTVSVNISGLHLIGGEVATELAALLAHTTFDRSRLRVELTESFLLDDPELAAARLDEIRDLGAQIVIDDFGTGFSSLTYLHALPIDGLKLDRSFVSRLGLADNDETIVHLVNDLAVGLHLDLVAEGVETEEQRRSLEAHGYRKGQGYLWSRPVPIRELWALLHDDPARTSPTSSR